MKEIMPRVARTDDGLLVTENLVPGKRVYDEELIRRDGREYRTWNPTKSKLGAYILKGGGRQLPLNKHTRMLYLGAANGTTPSHVSDIVRDGVLWAVEFSPRSFRDLLMVSEPRDNMVPFLGDAWKPSAYARLVSNVDVLYQDIAQRNQAAIFARNLEHFDPPWGLLMIKARSVDVAAPPRRVFEQVVEDVRKLSGYDVVEVVDLGPFEKDHAAALFRRKGGNRSR